MKRFLLVSCVSLIFISGCKKDDVAVAKNDIVGTWYYQSNNVQYYDNNVQVRYIAYATQYQLYNDPSYLFNKDNTGTYATAALSYLIKKGGGVDSLILNAGINTQYSLRFRIVSITKDNMELERTAPDHTAFRDQSNNIVYSSYTQTHSTFSRVQVTYP